MTVKRVPFVIGASKLGVTSGGGSAHVVVIAEKAAWSSNVVVAWAIMDGISGTAEHKI